MNIDFPGLSCNMILVSIGSVYLDDVISFGASVSEALIQKRGLRYS